MFRFGHLSVLGGWPAVETIEPEGVRHRRHPAVGDQRLDRRGRHRRQQITVAVMAGGDREPSDPGRAENRRVVDRATVSPDAPDRSLAECAHPIHREPWVRHI
jgi:hypothetical protein